MTPEQQEAIIREEIARRMALPASMMSEPALHKTATKVRMGLPLWRAIDYIKLYWRVVTGRATQSKGAAMKAERKEPPHEK